MQFIKYIAENMGWLANQKSITVAVLDRVLSF